MPREEGGQQLPIRLAEAVNLLAAVEDRPPQTVLREMMKELVSIEKKVK